MYERTVRKLRARQQWSRGQHNIVDEGLVKQSHPFCPAYLVLMLMMLLARSAISNTEAAAVPSMSLFEEVRGGSPVRWRGYEHFLLAPSPQRVLDWLSHSFHAHTGRRKNHTLTLTTISCVPDSKRSSFVSWDATLAYKRTAITTRR